MNSVITADEIVRLVQESIVKWHKDAAGRSEDYVIVTDEIKRRRPMNQFRSDMAAVVTDLTMTNTEIWHIEDKVRKGNRELALKSVRDSNILNCHRNDMIEELDEFILYQCGHGGIS